MTPNYPEISIQSAIDPSPWWTEDGDRNHWRGHLIRAFLPHVDQIPYTLTPIGRAEATKHDQVMVKIEPLRIGQPQPQVTLPLAAMPAYFGESRIVQRAKKRPALVLSEGGTLLPKEMIRGRPKYQIRPTMLVIPSYGGDADGTRAGFPPEFLDRVRRCEFPQYMCERLPLRGSSESVFRFDHIQPIGKHHDSIEWTKHRLSEDAMEIIDEWTTWILTGLLPEDGLIYPARKQFLSFD